MTPLRAVESDRDRRISAVIESAPTASAELIERLRALLPPVEPRSREAEAA